jgi:3-hydroxyacyl-CoA dehydrogenase
MNIKNISVIGAGTMGNGIAHVFAQTGFAVTLIDVNAGQLEKALATISKNLDRQIAKGSLTEEQKKTDCTSTLKARAHGPAAGFSFRCRRHRSAVLRACAFAEQQPP